MLYMATLEPEYWSVFPEKKPQPANAAPAAAPAPATPDTSKKTTVAAIVPAGN
jgi:hypothetical protein